MASQASTLSVEERGVRRAVTACVIGNFVEWYDYGIYGFMATVIAANFFAPGDPVAALMGTFALFAVSFIMRPVGGVVFGRYGDKIGRRTILAITIITMAAATTAMGLLPTYASVGILAPILLLILRLVQGFAAGGEYAGAVSFAVEYAPENRRALYASFLQSSLFAGLLLGAWVAVLFTVLLGEEAMGAWAWRIPFLAAGPLGLIGLYLRIKVQETPEFRAIAQRSEGVSAAPLREAIRTQWRPMAVFFGFGITMAVGVYILSTYFVSYLIGQVGLNLVSALVSISVALLTLALTLPIAGLLADQIGRKPMLLAGCVGFLVLTLPAVLVASRGGLFFAALGLLILAVPVFFISPALSVSIAEMFPTRVRYSASAITYNLTFSVFGGTAPLVATALVGQSGRVEYLAYYMMGLAAVSTLVVVLSFKEAHGSRLAQEIYK